MLCNYKLSLSFTYFFVTIYLLFSPKANAQIATDNTVNTQIEQNGNITEISGGQTRGENLFHSFQDFSVGTSNEAFFNNATNISNIFSRVTGSNISNIDGLIRANGSANLFLINPAGILLGENARLDIGGSFLASTAETIKFDDGQFSAIALNKSTITVNLPIGLGFGSNPGDIAVQGMPNNVVVEIPSFRVNTDNLPSAIQVNPEKNITLIGGNINFDGGGLQAPGGNIELGSVKGNESVDLVASENAWFIANFDKVTGFNNINFNNAAFVDVSNTVAGNINLNAREILLDDSSVILANTSQATDNSININATNLLQLQGTNRENKSNEFYSISIIGADVLSGSEGKGNNININTEQLQIFDAGQIRAVNFANFPEITTGDINLNTKNILLRGTNNIDGLIASLVNTSTAIGSQGDGGNVNISTQLLNVENGARVKADTFGGGQGGKLRIVADEVNLQGSNPFIDFFPTGLSTAASPEGTQESIAGDIEIEVQSLNVIDGAAINSSSAGRGLPGNIKITAKEVNVRGFNPFITRTPSGISASVSPIARVDRSNLTSQAGNITIDTVQLKVLDGGVLKSDTSVGNSGDINIDAENIELNGTKPKVGDFIGGISTSTRETSFGNGGDITINTSSLKVLNGSIIRAISLGSGDAGNITVNAKTIEISGFDRFAPEPIEPQRVSKINTGAQFNNGGNIFIDSDSIKVQNLGRIESSSNGDGIGGQSFINSNSIILQNQGKIIANTSDGIGGNININSDAILGLENSDITANAVGGNGGNINIDSDVILGLESRSQLTPFSDITASSEFGIDGTIKLNSPNDFADDETLVTIENLEPNSTEKLIEQSCFGQNRSPNTSRIVDSGRAGVPESPDNYFDGGDPIGYLGHRQVLTNSDEIDQQQPVVSGNANTFRNWQPGDPIVEANAVEVNSDGSQSLIHVNSTKSADQQLCQGEL
jgi:filamentous hemagglutinin family protein